MLRLTAPRHSALHCVIKFFVPLICHLCKWNWRSRALLSAAAPCKITLFQHKIHIAVRRERERAAAGTAVMCNHFIGGLVCEFFACSPSPARHSPESINRERASDADPLVKCIFISRSSASAYLEKRQSARTKHSSVTDFALWH